MKARLRMLQHAQRLSGNVSQTCSFFGVSRSLYYIWKKRLEQKGLAGLRDLKRRPCHIRYRIPPEIVSLVLRIREERRYEAVRTSLYLQRHYDAYVLPTTMWPPKQKQPSKKGFAGPGLLSFIITGKFADYIAFAVM